MDLTRTTMAALALGRIAFGVGYLARPDLAGPTWIGRAARKPGTRVIIRSQAARDLGMGLGGLRALLVGRDDEAARWLAAYALADTVDAVATWSAREAVGPRRTRNVLAVAGGSAVGCAVGAVVLGRDDR